MKGKSKRIAGIIVLTLVMIFSGLIGSGYGDLKVQAASTAPYRIHFINVGRGDAILLESNGHYGLIDGGEDSYHFVHGEVETPHQYAMMKYIKKIAGNANGQVKLDFIIVSHIHSDHIGGSRVIVNDPSFTVDKVYMKAYSPTDLSRIAAREASNKNDAGQPDPWDSVQQYNNFKTQCTNRKIGIDTSVQNRTISLGNFSIKFYNAAVKAVTTGDGLDVNSNSLATLVKANGKAVLLTGDVAGANDQGLLNEINGAREKIDLVKVPHHGSEQNSPLLTGLKSKYAVVTNYWQGVTAGMKSTLQNIAAYTAVYPVGNNNSMVIDFSLNDFGLSGYKTKNDIGVTWVPYGSTWIYKTEGGVNATGFAYDSALNDPGYHAYYLRRFQNDCGTGDTGTMVKGWVNYNNDWYYFRPAETVEYGTNLRAPEGSMARGWLQDGYWYFLRRGTDQKGLDGTVVTGWLNEGNAWYYLILNQEGQARKGAMVTGTRNIDGVVYVFNSSGVLTSHSRPVGQ